MQKWILGGGVGNVGNVGQWLKSNVWEFVRFNCLGVTSQSQILGGLTLKLNQTPLSTINESVCLNSS